MNRIHTDRNRKCQWYHNDTGQPIASGSGTGCLFRLTCTYVHPDDKEWDQALPSLTPRRLRQTPTSSFKWPPSPRRDGRKDSGREMQRGRSPSPASSKGRRHERSRSRSRGRTRSRSPRRSRRTKRRRSSSSRDYSYRRRPSYSRDPSPSSSSRAARSPDPTRGRRRPRASPSHRGSSVDWTPKRAPLEASPSIDSIASSINVPQNTAVSTNPDQARRRQGTRESGEITDVEEKDSKGKDSKGKDSKGKTASFIADRVTDPRLRRAAPTLSLSSSTLSKFATDGVQPSLPSAAMSNATSPPATTSLPNSASFSVASFIMPEHPKQTAEALSEAEAPPGLTSLNTQVTATSQAETSQVAKTVVASTSSTFLAFVPEKAPDPPMCTSAIQPSPHRSMPKAKKPVITSGSDDDDDKTPTTVTNSLGQQLATRSIPVPEIARSEEPNEAEPPRDPSEVWRQRIESMSKAVRASSAIQKLDKELTRINDLLSTSISAQVKQSLTHGREQLLTQRARLEDNLALVIKSLVGSDEWFAALNTPGANNNPLPEPLLVLQALEQMEKIESKVNSLQQRLEERRVAVAIETNAGPGAHDALVAKMDVDEPSSSKATNAVKSGCEDKMPVDKHRASGSLNSRISRLDERIEELVATQQSLESEIHDNVEERIKEVLDERFPLETETSEKKAVKDAIANLDEEVRTMDGDIKTVAVEMAALIEEQTALRTENHAMLAENIKLKQDLIALRLREKELHATFHQELDLLKAQLAAKEAELSQDRPLHVTPQDLETLRPVLLEFGREAFGPKVLQTKEEAIKLIDISKQNLLATLETGIDVTKRNSDAILQFMQRMSLGMKS